MVLYQLIIDAHVFQAQTWQFGHKAVILGIQPGADDINELDRAPISRPGFEKLFLASA